MSNTPEEKAIQAGYHRAILSISKVAKDADNPYFGSKYIPLDSIQAAIKDALLQEGLAIAQNVDYIPDGQCVRVSTLLISAGGDRVVIGDTRLPVPKMTPQDAGSAFTYARRYALSSLFTIIADNDDDGEGAQKPHRTPSTQAPAPKPAPVESPASAVADNFTDANTAPSFTARGKVHVWAQKNIKQLSAIVFASSLPDEIKKRGRFELAKIAMDTKNIDSAAAAEVLRVNGAEE